MIPWVVVGSFLTCWGDEVLLTPRVSFIGLSFDPWDEQSLSTGFLASDFWNKGDATPWVFWDFPRPWAGKHFWNSEVSDKFREFRVSLSFCSVKCFWTPCEFCLSIKGEFLKIPLTGFLWLSCVDDEDVDVTGFGCVFDVFWMLGFSWGLVDVVEVLKTSYIGNQLQSLLIS